jgi:hypothetical protein
VIFLKGRQIGVTWIVLAVDVAEAIQKPGTVSLIYRQRHDEAVDNVRRWWQLYESLPPHFTEHIKVIKPDRADRPGMDGVALQFPELAGEADLGDRADVVCRGFGAWAHRPACDSGRGGAHREAGGDSGCGGRACCGS